MSGYIIVITLVFLFFVFVGLIYFSLLKSSGLPGYKLRPFLRIQANKVALRMKFSRAFLSAISKLFQMNFFLLL
ncbi:hypothetical protein BDE36_3171 [Arcticibacter tournemirensis]|nr:hypothetical protein BDE36_3171 [Arcticibacter tournemirensis]